MKTQVTLNRHASVLAILSASWPLLTGVLAQAQDTVALEAAADLPSPALVLEAPSPSPGPKATLRFAPSSKPVTVDVITSAQLAQKQSVDAQLHLLNDLKRHNSDYEESIYTKYKTGGDLGGRTLVVPAGAPDPKEMMETEEDLEVMAHLLAKSMNLSKEGGRIKAAGIDLLLSPGAVSGARNLYLAGHGALFLLPSPIPLKPTEAKAEEAKKEPSKSSAWDEARRELYRGPEPRWIESRDQGRKERTLKETYSEEDLSRLKSSVFDCLKEASNMRHVAPGESISVVLTRDSRRGGAIAFANQWLQKANAFQIVTDDEKAERNNDATLLIRVTKASVDALAAGSITLEQFKDKAVVVLY